MVKRDVQMNDIIEAVLELARLSVYDPVLYHKERKQAEAAKGISARWIIK